jgi:hypothetical protein
MQKMLAVGQKSSEKGVISVMEKFSFCRLILAAVTKASIDLLTYEPSLTLSDAEHTPHHIPRWHTLRQFRDDNCLENIMQ